MKQNFSLYRFVTEEEQTIFKQLIGDAFETEALLVSTKESTDQKEYIFIYNHPTEEMNNLVSFYGKVKKSKELELLEFATAQLTEKMILRNVKEVADLVDTTLKGSVSRTIQFSGHPITLKYSQDHYSLSNQGASFAALCVKTYTNGTIDYYVLTAHHCTNSSSNELIHCSKGDRISLVLDGICKKANDEFLKNKIDAGIYKVNQVIDKNGFFYKNLLKFNDNYDIPENTKSRKSFHDINAITAFVKMNDNFETYCNGFICKTSILVVTGQSGGAVFNGNKFTGVLSGEDDGKAFVANAAGVSKWGYKNIKDILVNQNIELI